MEETCTLESNVFTKQRIIRVFSSAFRFSKLVALAYFFLPYLSETLRDHRRAQTGRKNLGRKPDFFIYLFSNMDFY